MDSGRPAYRWVVLGAWIVSHVLSFSTISVLGILLPSITAELGLSPAQQGVLGSSAQWGTMVLAIPFALWGSRYNPVLLTTGTLTMGAACVFIQGLAPGFAVLLVARLLFGLTISARRAGFALLLQQWFSPKEIVLANGVVNGVFGAVMGMGWIGTPFLLDAVGGDWRNALYVLGGVLTAATIVWTVLGRQRITPEYAKQVQSQEGSPLGSIFRYRDLWVCCLAFLGAQLAWMAFTTFWPTLMLDGYGASLNWSGSILGINSLAAAAGGLAVGLLAAQPRRRRVVLIAAGPVLALTLAAMNLTGSIPLLTALDLVNGVAWGFWPLLMALPFGLPGIKPREVAVALALLDTSMLVGGATGPVLAGFVQEATGDIRVALVVASMFCLTLSVTGLLVRARRREVAATA
jgi:predicted MFS family arabinose efflux permease